jgi:hypothetical protein
LRGEVEKGTINHRERRIGQPCLKGRERLGGRLMMRRFVRFLLTLAIATCVDGGLAVAADPPCAFDRITLLPASFDPTGSQATPVGIGPIPQNVQADLTAAFELAPAFFQKQLCGLDGVFVTQGGDSWGFRNIADGKRYLAVSIALWKNGVPRYSEYEDLVVRRLLHGWSGPRHSKNTDEFADGPAVTVLALVAHEFGHILFYDTFVNPRGSAPNYAAFCDGKFFAGSWETLPHTPVIWRRYGEIAGLHKGDDVQINEIIAALPKPGAPDTRHAGRLLQRIFALAERGKPGGRWASLFAAFSPDEDFVETFKLFVLRNSAAPLQTLKIEIPIEGRIVTEDIPGQCNKRPVLMTKLGCFAKTYCPGATTDACGVVCPH